MTAEEIAAAQDAAFEMEWSAAEAILWRESVMYESAPFESPACEGMPVEAPPQDAHPAPGETGHPHPAPSSTGAAPRQSSSRQEAEAGNRNES
jgi:hypothetical protein